MHQNTHFEAKVFFKNLERRHCPSRDPSTNGRGCGASICSPRPTEDLIRACTKQTLYKRSIIIIDLNILNTFVKVLSAQDKLYPQSLSALYVNK